jgi:hypothetical protein
MAWEVVSETDAMPPAMAAEQQRREGAMATPARAPAREGSVPLMGGPEGKPLGGTVRGTTAAGGTGSGLLPPEADRLFERVRTVEGTAGNPWQIYGGDTFKAGKEHPGEVAKRSSPNGTTHAAGPGQWQETTWNGLKPSFRERYGRDPDFSSLDDQKAMTWANAAKHYPGGEEKLRADLAAGKLNEQALAGEWEGFKRGGSSWQVTGGGKWRVSDNAIAYEQGRKNTSVVWMNPDDYLAMTPDAGGGDKRKSLLKSLGAGDAIEAIPTLDAKLEGGRLKVFDQDGRSRARIAKDEGVGLIPVAIHGVTSDQPPAWLEDMNGMRRRFNFEPVGKISAAARGAADPYDSGGGGALGRIASRAVERGGQGFGAAPIGQGTDIGRDLTSVGTPGTADLGLPVRALGTGADLVGRGLMAAVGGVTGAAGQTVRELGNPEIPAINPGGAPGNVANAVEAAPELSLGMLGVPGLLPGGGPVVSPRLASLPRVVPPPAVSPPVNNMLGAIRGTTSALNEAVELINKRAAADEAATPGAQAAAVGTLEAGRAAGEPIAPIDVLGGNVKGLGGRAARMPGPSRQVAERWAESRRGDVDRTSPIAQSIHRGIDELLGTDTAKSQAQHLADGRSARARPLWRRAEQATDALPKVEQQLAKEYPAAKAQAEASAAAVAKAQERLDAFERDAAQQGVRVPRAPVRLSDWLLRRGGLQDQGGEVSHIIGGRKALSRKPGARNDEATKLQHRLLKTEGETLDDAALAAWEAGYVATHERPTIAEFLDALAQDINGRPVYSGLDRDLVADYEAALQRTAEASRSRADRPMPKARHIGPKELAAEREAVEQLKAKASRERALADELRDLVEAGQADGTIGLAGAVTSPVIRRLVTNPRIKRGLSRGAALDRDEADATGRPYHTRDYAVIGTDANGEPMIGAVPTMKLLMKAKEGLDSMLEAERHELTGRLTPEGRVIVMLRNTLLKELDRLNPDYKIARDQWAGDTALIKAIADGKKFNSWDPEAVAERLAGASDSEKRFLRIGYADTLRKDLDEKVLNADPSKAMINSTADRQRIELVAGSPEAAQKFIDKIKRSRQQFQTPVDVLGNSKTAAREAEDLHEGRQAEAGTRMLTGLAKGAMGHTAGAVSDFARAHQHWIDPRSSVDPKVLTNVMRILAGEGEFANLRLNPAGDLLNKFPLPNVQSTLQRGAANLLRRPIPNAMLTIGGLRPR